MAVVDTLNAGTCCRVRKRSASPHRGLATRAGYPERYRQILLVFMRRLSLVLSCLGLTMPGCSLRTTPDWLELKRSIRAEFPGVPQITTEELAEWLNDPSREPPVLLDARDPKEFALSHLRNAHLAPDAATAVRVVGDAKPNPPIVVYCSVGYRSSRLAKDLMDRGFANVANLEGSIFQWANEERPVYQGLERVERVHPFDNTWGRLLDSRFRERTDK